MPAELTEVESREVMAPELLPLAADFVWRCGADLRIEELSPLDLGCDEAVAGVMRGIRLDRLAQRVLYPAQAAALTRLVGQRAPLRNLALSCGIGDERVLNLTLNADVSHDGEGRFSGYYGVGKLWPTDPFDERQRAEMVELLDRSEASRSREQRLREEADVLLESLRTLIQPAPLAEKCASLFGLFGRLLRFEEALVVRRRSRTECLAVVATDPALVGMNWPVGTVVQRAFAGHADVIADLSQTAEWRELPEAVRSRFRTALVAPLTIGNEAAMLIALHGAPGHFEASQVALMQRLSLAATQAFQADEQKNVLMNTAKLATLGELMTVIAHEISQPLSVISMAVKNAKLAIEAAQSRGRSSEDMPIVMNKLDRIHDQALRAGEIVTAIRTLAHPDRRTIGLKPVAVGEIIDNIRNLTEGSLRNRGIALICEQPPYCRPLRANPVSLQQVFLNLVVNARDAITESCRERSQAIKGTIHITVLDDGRSDIIYVEIADTGGGIPPDVMARIFDSFFTLKEVGHGSGLGLAICRTLMTDMGGEITARNNNMGAVFRLEIPVYRDDPNTDR